MDNKTILITGGTGSFGSAFIKHVLHNYNTQKIIVFSRDWLKQKNLREELNNPPVMRWFIGDIRDKDRLRRAFNKVDIVIHAAAIKDLESCEYNPSEAMLTNVTGTQNVIDAGIEMQVEKLLFISTDKAVNPINVYGTSKAMAEQLWLNANRYATEFSKFSVCRYGNVVGSAGSVVPFFKKLISEGIEILPVTHPDMTRFWFSMPLAIQFVLESLAVMVGEELFKPMMPSVRIVDLCAALNMPYTFVGIRKGEKIHEEMSPGYSSDKNSFLTVDEIRKSIE